jgi:hypothetical protein
MTCFQHDVLAVLGAEDREETLGYRAIEFQRGRQLNQKRPEFFPQKTDLPEEWSQFFLAGSLFPAISRLERAGRIKGNGERPRLIAAARITPSRSEAGNRSKKKRRNGADRSKQSRGISKPTSIDEQSIRPQWAVPFEG